MVYGQFNDMCMSVYVQRLAIGREDIWTRRRDWTTLPYLTCWFFWDNAKWHGGFQLVMGVPLYRWMVYVMENLHVNRRWWLSCEDLRFLLAISFKSSSTSSVVFGWLEKMLWSWAQWVRNRLALWPSSRYKHVTISGWNSEHALRYTLLLIIINSSISFLNFFAPVSVLLSVWSVPNWCDRCLKHHQQDPLVPPLLSSGDHIQMTWMIAIAIPKWTQKWPEMESSNTEDVFV